MTNILKHLIPCIPCTPSAPPPADAPTAPQAEQAQRPPGSRIARGMRNARANVERVLCRSPKAARTPGDERDQMELALRSDRMYGSPQAARVKDRGAEVKALRASEFDAATGLFRIHPGRIAVPCEGDVDPAAKAALNAIGAELKGELDRHLEKAGAASCDGISREKLVKALVPYKWIVSEDMQIMIGKSKLAPAEGTSSARPEKMGHITLIGGSAEPKGRLGGLLYCTKQADGNYEFCLDNDSGRFSEAEDRNPQQLANVAARFNQIGLDFQVRPVWIDLKATPAT